VREYQFAPTLPWYRLLRSATWSWNVSGTRFDSLLTGNAPALRTEACG
jgi:hypothetical protein